MSDWSLSRYDTLCLMFVVSPSPQILLKANIFSKFLVLLPFINTKPAICLQKNLISACKCNIFLSGDKGETPRRTRGSLIGMVNEREFGVSFLEANITDNMEEGRSTLQAHLDNIPPTVGE